MLAVSYESNRFIAHVSFDKRKEVMGAGFSWDPKEKLWYTYSPTSASRLRRFFDQTAEKKIKRTLILERPWSGSLSYPNGLKPAVFKDGYSQAKAVAFALSRNRSYLGMATGTGKTIVAALIANALQAPTVIVSPSGLVPNIEAEFTKWTVGKAKIGKLEPRKATPKDPDILLVPSSIVHRDETKAEIRKVTRWANVLGKEPLLMVDEAQQFNTIDSMRTEALFGEPGESGGGLVSLFPRQVYLSATPMKKRPIELYPILSRVAPETIDYMTRDEYGMKYCGACRDEFGHWDFSGASKLKELRAKVVGKFMYRVPKSVLDLPPMQEEILVIGARPAKLIAMDMAILEKHSPEDLVKDQIGEPFIASYRRELGVLKTPHSLKVLRELVELRDYPLVIFAFHKEVIEMLVGGLAKYDPLSITGATPRAKRKAIVDEFQRGKRKRPFIGNYLAAGLGWTLVRSSEVHMVEPSWVHTENEQARDRVYRMGQTQSVRMRYHVFENSLDKAVLRVNFRDRKTISHL